MTIWMLLFQPTQLRKQPPHKHPLSLFWSSIAPLLLLITFVVPLLLLLLLLLLAFPWPIAGFPVRTSSTIVVHPQRQRKQGIILQHHPTKQSLSYISNYIIRNNRNSVIVMKDSVEDRTTGDTPAPAHTSTNHPEEGSSSVTNDHSTIERSTILFLEHINLNIPYHSHATQFYIQLLGCGYDPRRFGNVIGSRNGPSTTIPSTTIWANAGPSQFHLPYGIVGQSILGKIGIRIRDTAWLAFQQRVSQVGQEQRLESLDRTTITTTASHHPILTSITSGLDRYQNEYIEITDQFQNVFYCRPTTFINTNTDAIPPLQPVVTRNDPKYLELYGTERFHQYISQNATDRTDCCGIDFIEFHCPVGTATKIATFYNVCFDVPVQVVDQEKEEDGNNNKSNQQKKMAMIAIGNIDVETGRTDQSLLFREVDDYDATRRMRYQNNNDNDDDDIDDDLDHQYHIAMYVGDTVADFQQAYRHCDMLDLIYINPRFSDRADTLEAATEHYQQFRIRHIVDVESTNGNVILTLEHEIRSIHHEAWLGKK